MICLLVLGGGLWDGRDGVDDFLIYISSSSVWLWGCIDAYTHFPSMVLGVRSGLEEG